MIVSIHPTCKGKDEASFAAAVVRIDEILIT